MFSFWPLFQKHTSLSPLSSAPFPTYPLNGSSNFMSTAIQFYLTGVVVILAASGGASFPLWLNALQLLGSTPSWSSPPGHGGFSTSTSSVPSPTVSPTQQSARRGSANTWQQISWSLTVKPPLQIYGLPWLRDQCKPKSDHFLHHPPSLQACPVKSFSVKPPISCSG